MSIMGRYKRQTWGWKERRAHYDEADLHSLRSLLILLSLPHPHPTPLYPPAHPPHAHAAPFCSVPWSSQWPTQFSDTTFKLGLNVRKNERRRQTAWKRNPSFPNNTGKTMSQVPSQPRCSASVPRGTNAALGSLDVVVILSCEGEI